MNLAFAAPWALVLLLAAPLFWTAAMRSGTNLSRRHLYTVAVMRTLAFALLVCAMGQPVWNGKTEEVSVVYALDLSRSIAAEYVSDALRWIDMAQDRFRPAQSRIVVFARQPVVVASTADARTLASAAQGKSAGTLDRSATNLESALDETLAVVSRDRIKRIVLLSDGNETEGEVANVVPRLRAAGIRVFPIPAKTRSGRDFWVDGIEVPEHVRRHEPVSVVVRVFSPARATATVRLGGVKGWIAVRSARLAPGMNQIGFDTRLAEAGAVMLKAEVQAEGDTVPENDRLQVSLWVEPAPRVLYVEGQQGAEGYLARALRSEGIDVEIAEARAIPETAPGMLRYDAVILSDVPGKKLSVAQMRAIDSYVRDYGGGLLFASGENTFGEQGYSGSLLEKALPVEFKAQEKRKDLALVIAIDRSYSMKGRKMEYAKEAARAALDLLEEQHRFAVVAFDSQPYISVPMQEVRSKRRAEAQISRIQASGQTNIYPALGVVYRLLQQVDAKTKHVILLSDGDTQPADFERLIGRMQEKHIVVSTVTIGSGGNPQLMKDIATWGKGRSYLAASAESIPQIFIDETRKVVRSNLVEEAILPVVKHGMHAFTGVDFSDAPPLTGHVSVKTRNTAEVYLATQEGAPLLARWQYGLGKSLIFTSGVKGRWAGGWLEWSGYGKLWAQLVRDTMRRDSGESADFRLNREGDDVVVSLSLLTEDGRFRNQLLPRARIRRGGAPVETVQLGQVGPGSYEMRVPFGDGSSFTAELLPGGGLGGRTATRAGARTLFSGFPAEYRSLPPNLDLLADIAVQTGGKLAPQVDEVFDAHGDSAAQSRALWPWLALIALAAYLLDILLRRSPLAWRRLGS